MKLLALCSNDSSLWLDLRSHLVAAVRVAADLGGTGDLSITGFLGGGPDDVYRATARANGESGIEVLTAEQAQLLAKRVIDAAEPLLEALVEKARPPGKLELPSQARALHGEVCGLLRAASDSAVLAAANQNLNLFFFSPDKKPGLFHLAKLFPTARAMADGLEKAWPALMEFQCKGLPMVALRILACVDPAQAARLAKAYAASDAPPELRATAEALLIALETEADVEAALKKLRKALPENTHHELHVQLQGFPLVRRLRESGSPVLHDVVRRELCELTGAPGRLKQLPDAEQVYAYALTVILDAMAGGNDLPLLFRLWTDSPGFQMLDYERLARHQKEAQPFLASLFGRQHTSYWARTEQWHASRAIMAENPERALAVVRELLTAATRTEAQDHAIECLLELLVERPAPPSDAWLELLSQPQMLSRPTVLHVLVTWKRPGTGDRVLAAMHDQLEVDDACQLLEKLGDGSVVPALRAFLDQLSPQRKRDRNRLDQCIKRLSGTEVRGNQIEAASSGRAACRGCKEKIAKGELRFGEEVQNVFSDSGEPTLRWYHLKCAAEKKPALLLAALEGCKAETPGREELVATAQARLAKKKTKRK